MRVQGGHCREAVAQPKKQHRSALCARLIAATTAFAAPPPHPRTHHPPPRRCRCATSCGCRRTGCTGASLAGRGI